MSIKRMYRRQVTGGVGCALVELNTDNGSMMVTVDTGNPASAEVVALNPAELADVLGALGLALVSAGSLGLDGGRADVGEELAALAARLGAFSE